jgi:fructose-1,6-bisphosphatase/inositol monophosphatase family enzyme
MSAAALERIHASASAFQSLTPAVCAGVEYPKLAKGEADFALYNKSEPWDHLPGLAIVAEQGFQYARHDGSPYRPGDNTGGLMIAPDRTSLAEIRAILIGD